MPHGGSKALSQLDRINGNVKLKINNLWLMTKIHPYLFKIISVMFFKLQIGYQFILYCFDLSNVIRSMREEAINKFNLFSPNHFSYNWTSCICSFRTINVFMMMMNDHHHHHHHHQQRNLIEYNLTWSTL